MKRMLLIVALLFLASCKGEGNAYAQLVKADRKQLLNDARALQARYVKRPSEEVPRSAWPASIAAFHPEKVTVGQWGVWVQTDSFFFDASGLYIGTDSTYPPPRRGEIEPNFHWYSSPPGF